MAFAAQCQWVQLIAVEPQLLNSCVLDRHTVGIPAGNIRGVKATCVFVFDDDILQNFVECMTHVDFAVCIRRTVMQNKFGVPFMQGLLLKVDIVVLPVLQNFGLTLRQACAHRELCFRQIQCFAIIH